MIVCVYCELYGLVDITVSLSCKAKRQYMLTLHVSRYCLSSRAELLSCYNKHIKGLDIYVIRDTTG